VDQLAEAGRIVRIGSGGLDKTADFIAEIGREALRSAARRGIERAAVRLLGLISGRARGRIRSRRDVKAVSGPRGLCRRRLIELVEEVARLRLGRADIGLVGRRKRHRLGLIRRKLLNSPSAHPAAQRLVETAAVFGNRRPEHILGVRVFHALLAGEPCSSSAVRTVFLDVLAEFAVKNGVLKLRVVDELLRRHLTAKDFLRPRADVRAHDLIFAERAAHAAGVRTDLAIVSAALDRRYGVGIARPCRRRR
jgi:hypothetical protein